MTTELKERGVGALSLPELAAEANRHHQCALDAGTAMIEHAREAGEHLLAAKSKCAHGEWGAWLDKNCEFSERTAQRYMRVAQRWPELETAAKTTRVSDLPIRDALAMLAEPPRPNGQPAPVETLRATEPPPRTTPTRPSRPAPVPEPEDDRPAYLRGTDDDRDAQALKYLKRMEEDIGRVIRIGSESSKDYDRMQQAYTRINEGLAMLRSLFKKGKKGASQ